MFEKCLLVGFLVCHIASLVGCPIECILVHNSSSVWERGGRDVVSDETKVVTNTCILPFHSYYSKASFQ